MIRVTHRDGATEDLPETYRADEGGPLSSYAGETVHLCGVPVFVEPSEHDTCKE